MTAMETLRTETTPVGGGFGFERGVETPGIVSECDAWLNARPAPPGSAPHEGGFWSSAEVEAYFARRRAENAT